MTGSRRLPGRRGHARAPLADLLLGGLGLSMATASAGFAGYMIATAPAEVTASGSKDFNIFVQWDRRAPQTHAPAQSPPPTAMAATEAPAPTQAGTGIDTTPTGTIPPAGALTRVPRTGSMGSTAPLHDFRLRDVYAGHALIEHDSKLSLVQPGSTLAGAGKVLAIERQGGGWIVRTAAGVIGGFAGGDAPRN